MRPWQFDALFFVGVGGTIFLAAAPSLGIEAPGPGAVGGIGAILAFVLTQRDKVTRPPRSGDDKQPTDQETDA